MDDADSKFPSQLADRFQVRMPDGMRDRLRTAAEANNRSMNAEILSRIESSFRYEEDMKLEYEALKDVSDYRRNQLVHVKSELEFADAYARNLSRRLLTLQREIESIDQSRNMIKIKTKDPEGAP